MHCPSSGTHDPSVTRDVGLSGRQAERAALDRLADSVRAGRGAALVVRGEAGVGKTALLDDLAARARGCLIVRLAGVEAEKLGRADEIGEAKFLANPDEKA